MPFSGSKCIQICNCAADKQQMIFLPSSPTEIKASLPALKGARTPQHPASCPSSMAGLHHFSFSAVPLPNFGASFSRFILSCSLFASKKNLSFPPLELCWNDWRTLLSSVRETCHQVVRRRLHPSPRAHAVLSVLTPSALRLFAVNNVVGVSIVVGRGVGVTVVFGDTVFPYPAILFASPILSSEPNMASTPSITSILLIGSPGNLPSSV